MTKPNRLVGLFAGVLILVTHASSEAALSTTRVASGLERPVYATAPPGDDERLFVLEQHSGRIRIVELATNTIRTTDFLTIGGLATEAEQGLLGLAFHPDYATGNDVDAPSRPGCSKPGNLMNRDFVEMLAALCAANADFLLVGAHALAVHGVPRATGDLALWVRPTPENSERVWNALVAFGAPLGDLTHDDLQAADLVFQIGLPPCRIDL